MKKYTGLYLGCIALVFFFILRSLPLLAESLYGKLVFPFLRLLIDNTFSKIPFSLIYIFIGLLSILFLFKLLRFISHRIDLKTFILSFINFIGIGIFFFYILWGYNYARPALKLRIEPESSRKLTLHALWVESIENAKLSRINHDISSEFPFYKNPQADLDKLPQRVKETLISLNYPAFGNPKVKTIEPMGTLRKMGITGMYVPFIGEGIVESSLSGWDDIFVRAHELSHAYGIGDEGEANYVAFLTCNNSKNPAWKYAANLNLIDQLLPYYYSDSLKGKESWMKLPPKIKEDRRLRIENAKQYKVLFPKFSQSVNDHFLQFQGIDAGIDSYDQFLQLTLQFGTSS